jgi:signal transduction histidine kinase
LKTPLSVLSGYTRLLLNGDLGELTEGQRRVLGEMESEAVRLQRFINDFLVFSASESGKFKPTLEPQDLNGIIGEIVTIWRPRFEHVGKSLEFIAASELPNVKCDELKIQHVLSNLLDNALKFTPKGGSVTVTTRAYFWERRVQSRREGGEQDRRRRTTPVNNAVRVDVQDSGPGISAEDHMEIFSEFRQLHSSKKSEGIGLGLAIAKRLVEAHGGKIWVESTPQSGATFSFLLATS